MCIQQECCQIKQLQKELYNIKVLNTRLENANKEWKTLAHEKHEALKQEHKRRLAATNALKTFINELKENQNAD